MIDPLQSTSVNQTGPVSGASQAHKATGANGGKFMDLLMNSLEEVNRLQQDADQSVQALYAGETDNVAEVFTAVNKAGVAFDLLMEVRNKLMDAYTEIQQIRV